MLVKKEQVIKEAKNQIDLFQKNFRQNLDSDNEHDPVSVAMNCLNTDLAFENMRDRLSS